MMSKARLSLVAAAFVAALFAAASVRADCSPGHNMSVQSTPQTVVDGTATTPPPPATTDQEPTKTGG